MKKIQDYDSDEKPNWCANGCGDFGIWVALKKALAEMDLGGDDVLVVYGVGCHGHMVNFTRVNGFEGLHGRPIPVAEGAKTANHDLPVIVIAGDGDTYGEGLGHFITAARTNHDITVIVHNNQVYGLTIGQTSPTSMKGFKTKANPEGEISEPVNPMSLAISAGASFVSRSFAGDIPHAVDTIKQAVRHKGFSLVDIFQPCVTFNKLNTYQWFRERVYKLEGHDPSDKDAAFKKSLEDDKLPIGLFYREERETYEEQLDALKKAPLVRQKPETGRDKLLEEFL